MQMMCARWKGTPQTKGHNFFLLQVTEIVTKVSFFGGLSRYFLRIVRLLCVLHQLGQWVDLFRIWDEHTDCEHTFSACDTNSQKTHYFVKSWISEC